MHLNMYFHKLLHKILLDIVSKCFFFFYCKTWQSIDHKKSENVLR